MLISLDIDFPVEPFTSGWRLLVRSGEVFARNFAFLAGVTLLVFVPAKLALAWLLSLLDVPVGGVLYTLLLSVSDLVLGAFVAPASIYGLVAAFRGKTGGRFGQSLRWGYRQWLRTLGNTLAMEITVGLYFLLIIVPGIIAAVKLIFTETIVAIEADKTRKVLDRSTELSEGYRWKIFFVMLPLGLLELGGNYVVGQVLKGAQYSASVRAVADSLFSVVAQWSTVAVLLMYLGIRRAKEQRG